MQNEGECCLILIMRDSAERAALKKSLLAFFPSILEADNSRQVLHLLQTHHVASILMEVEVPNLDALEFARKIRRRGNQTPLVFLARESLPKGTISEHSFLQPCWNLKQECSVAELQDVVLTAFAKGLEWLRLCKHRPPRASI